MLAASLAEFGSRSGVESVLSNRFLKFSSGLFRLVQTGFWITDRGEIATNVNSSCGNCPQISSSAQALAIMSRCTSRFFTRGRIPLLPEPFVWSTVTVTGIFITIYDYSTATGGSKWDPGLHHGPRADRDGVRRCRCPTADEEA
eukprot:1584143-Rhodomonas_salina.2